MEHAMASSKAYTESLEAMFRLRRFGIKLGLDVIRDLLQGLGNPQDSFRCVHVAGTNGKGSVAATLATLLQAAGKSVGLYTSPHLVKFNERIVINGQPVTDEEVVEAQLAVRALTSRSGVREPTFFEFATAMAMHVFALRKIDWAVIETGMGGRLDATNVVVPEVSIITNISLEHRAYLGNTLAAIAGEKAGIIKHRVPVVTGARQPSALGAIRSVAGRQQAPLHCYGRDFRIRRRGPSRFDYYGLNHRWSNLELALSGPHQFTNAALALAACEILGRLEPALTDGTQIADGLRRTRWPGRLEIVRQRPMVILDGAHNLAAARNLGRYLTTVLAGRRITLVAGILDDKPYQAMLRALVPPCQRVLVTRARIDRALDPMRLAAVVKNLGAAVKVYPTVASALSAAIDTAAPDEVICVAGSLYVVGEAKEALDTAGDMV
jgi:dihydrofolate synthase/folylpolyglutamate synthase